MPGLTRALLVGLVGAAMTAGACGRHAAQKPQSGVRNVAWRHLGSWSGRGSVQTESFTSETGALRVHWETSLAPAAGTPAAAPGKFLMTAHSAISGRLMQQVVDHSGPGNGTGYVQQDPHVFYIVVESDRLNWKFTVEEGIEYP